MYIYIIAQAREALSIHEFRTDESKFERVRLIMSAIWNISLASSWLSVGSVGGPHMKKAHARVHANFAGEFVGGLNPVERTQFFNALPAQRMRKVFLEAESEYMARQRAHELSLRQKRAQEELREMSLLSCAPQIEESEEREADKRAGWIGVYRGGSVPQEPEEE
jgi:hypothetical protein